ncbi:NosL [compost metagenome]
MYVWKNENGTDDIGKDYVRDYNDKGWIEVSKATYVYDASIRTPMAYGIVSFKDKASAEAFVTEQGVGQVLSADELANHSWQQNQDMTHEHHEHHGDAHGEDHDGAHGDAHGAEHQEDTGADAHGEHSDEHGHEREDDHDASSQQ